MRKTKTAAKPTEALKTKEEYSGTPATVWLGEKVVGKSFSWCANGELLYEGVIRDVLGYQTLLLFCFDHQESRAVEFVQPLETIGWDPEAKTGFRFEEIGVEEEAR